MTSRAHNHTTASSDYSTPNTIKCRTLNWAWRVVGVSLFWCNETDTLTRNWNYGLENVLTTWKPNTNEKRKRGKLQTRGYSQWRAAQLERCAMTSHQQAAWLLTYYWRSKRRRTHTTSDRNQSDCFQPKAMTSPRVTTRTITVNSCCTGRPEGQSTIANAQTCTNCPQESYKQGAENSSIRLQRYNQRTKEKNQENTWNQTNQTHTNTSHIHTITCTKIKWCHS